MAKLKIYTKTGDGGITSLFGGEKVAKNSKRITAYGTVDELNSLIGTIIAELNIKEVARKLTRIQEELMVLGSDLATPISVKVKIPRVTLVFVSRLEREIDNWEKDLPQLKNFILPGGSSAGSKLHLTRTIVRRAERAIVELADVEKINKYSIIYINRLSDWFFVLARHVNRQEGIKETIWKGRTG